MLKNKKNLILILVLFAALIVLKHFVPKPVSWEPSFNGYRKIPYGCSVLKGIIDSIYPGTLIKINEKSFYESLDTTQTGQLLLIINADFNPDGTDLNKLITFISKGNFAFIAAWSFAENFADTMQLKTESGTIDTSSFTKKTEKLNLHFASLPKQSFVFKRKMTENYFTSYDTLLSFVLGTDSELRPDYIVTSVGKGRVYTHCQPLAFTNFHILYSDYRYASAALSVIPVSKVIWDQYYKNDKQMNTSPVRYILSNPPLRSAYYVIVFSVFLYILLGWRRRQRIIPVMQSNRNTSLDFIRSIGKLYYKTFNHSDLAKKKLIYVNEYIKSKYGIKIPFESGEELESAARKTGVDPELLNSLAVRIKKLDGIWDYDSQELLTLHQKVEKFYKTCK